MGEEEEDALGKPLMMYWHCSSAALASCHKGVIKC